jgi:hypothetical protein
MSKESRQARFTVLDEKLMQETEGYKTADFICLDVPVHLIDQVYKQVLIAKQFQDATKDGARTADPNEHYVFGFYVEPHHQVYVGANKPDGSPPEVTYPTSLLTEEIPRD